MNSDALHGTWQLTSFEIEDIDGRRSWGRNVRGLLIYNHDGYMSVSINKDVEQAGEDESENILDSILFYSGTYRAESSMIYHQVTLASSPSRVGKEMKRVANLKGDALTLDTPPDALPRATLTWKRISK